MALEAEDRLMGLRAVSVSPFFSTILKNNITAQLVRQEIVGFSFEPQPGAAVAPRLL
jgi:hypothetical protein